MKFFVRAFGWLSLFACVTYFAMLLGICLVSESSLQEAQQKLLVSRHRVLPIWINLGLYRIHFWLTHLGQTPPTSPLRPLTLEIEPEAYSKFEEAMKEAQKTGVLLRGKTEKDLAKATLEENGKRYEVRVRLKGDWSDHAQPIAPSFRVESKEEAWQGMHVFSLQKPATRNFLGEWLLLHALRDENILAPRYEFVHLTLNGQDRGVYAVEEFFQKELLERMGRIEAPILKLDEDIMWKAKFYKNGFDYPKELPIVFFGEKKISKSETLRTYSQMAYSAYEQYQHQQKSFCQVFDCRLFARYSALLNLFQAAHGFGRHNARFYFNPVTTLLEPIGFDNDSLNGAETWPKITQFIQDQHDEHLWQEYQKALHEVTSEAYLNALWEKYRPAWESLHPHLLSDFLHWRYYHPSGTLYEQLKQSAETLKTQFDPPTHLAVRHRLEAQESFIGTKLRIDLASQVPFPVVIRGIRLKNKEIPPSQWKACPGLESLPKSHVLPGATLKDEFLRYVSVCLEIEKDLKQTISIEVITGLEYLPLQKVQTSVNFTPLEDYANLASRRYESLEPLLTKFEFLSLERETKQLQILPGTWDLKETLVIPEGYTLVMEAGTTLRMGQKASIFSFSALRWQGNAMQPIVIKPLEAQWGVLVVLQSQPSVLEHVVISGASEHQDNPFVTGGVVFYRSPVTMTEVSILKAKGEDALNIKESEFTLKNVEFQESHSDAFDSDFSKGTIENLVVTQTGNDALDLSGSRVSVKGMHASQIGDKGISVGEQSTLDVEGLTFGKKIMVGIASKDGSNVTIKHWKGWDQAQLPLVAYIKKEVYGPSSIFVADSLSKLPDSYILQDSCSISLQGNLLTANRRLSQNIAEEIEQMKHK